MSKKNRNLWQNTNAHTEPEASAPVISQPVAPAEDFAAISPAQLAANRANALSSTGPRTPAGLAKSSMNALKSALTGRTVLLPNEDIEEYKNFLAGFQDDLKPVGPLESELVQVVVDSFWRSRRIQALEYTLYAHGHSQFEHAFDHLPEDQRYNMILLQTHMTYEKQFRNWQIQEARIDRKRVHAMAELQRLQSKRQVSEDPAEPEMTEEELFAALDPGYIPPSIAEQFAKTAHSKANGFVFSNDEIDPETTDSSANPKAA